MRTSIVGWFECIRDISVDEAILLKNEDYFTELYIVVKGVLFFFELENEAFFICFSQSGGQMVSCEEKC